MITVEVRAGQETGDDDSFTRLLGGCAGQAVRISGEKPRWPTHYPDTVWSRPAIRTRRRVVQP
jgi:hypothetical protein